ncbi:hypothetical protein CCC_00557 [Paramagnetospirillum magnetotacticum MS-1]|uniref:Uncharacterized protein n=1 Tax=Paramagnetospirillum magnetotacticum MS-1 TaxID=272627 RepID=A0A0C2UXE4_PARME|nr:hypothetical protein [Paramagnetospirillum magnetotacticum]KIL97496.1 hypothetical protein CCC_00557 [Paramagnetospirillum magnetotacticum MS-1]
MASFDEQSRQRLFDYLQQSFDDDNAADLETFAQNFLHNGALWDRLADLFPNASATALRTVMTEAFAEWRKLRDRVH